MDDETRSEFAEMRAQFAESRAETRSEFAEMRAQFAKIDRWFELGQAQYMELRTDFADLKANVTEVKTDLSALRQEFHRFRDWATTHITEIRVAISKLTRRLEALER